MGKDSVLIRSRMIEFLESLGIQDSTKFVTFTKRQVYEGIGMDRPSDEFNKAWSYLSRSRAEFMSYDKELKSWVWL